MADEPERPERRWADIMRWSVEVFLLGLAGCALAALGFEGGFAALLAIGIPLMVVAVPLFWWGAWMWTHHKMREDDKTGQRPPF